MRAGKGSAAVEGVTRTSTGCQCTTDRRPGSASLAVQPRAKGRVSVQDAADGPPNPRDILFSKEN